MGGSSKTTQENNPPAWATPLFRLSAQDAMKLYQGGVGGHTYTGSTVAPLSDTTLSGLNQIVNAGQNTNTSATRGLFQGLGAGAVSNPYTAQSGGVAGTYNDIYNKAGGQTAADQYLTDYASGKYLNGEGNPFYRANLDKQIADSNAMLRSQFSGMGRSGSGADQNAVAKNTSDLLLQGLENDYNRQQQNQFNAVNMLDQARNAQIGNELGAAGGMLNAYGQAGNLYSTGIGQGLQSAEQMANLDQNQFQNNLTGANAVYGAGQALDAQTQKLLTDQIKAWEGKDNEDWTRLGLLQAAAGGAAGPYGTQTSRTSSSNPGALLSGVGSIMGGMK